MKGLDRPGLEPPNLVELRCLVVEGSLYYLIVIVEEVMGEPELVVKLLIGRIVASLAFLAAGFNTKAETLTGHLGI